MPRRLPNISAQAAAYVRSVERQVAQMRGDIRRLQDSSAGLNRGLRVPVPSGGSRYTKGSRTNPSIFLRAAESGIGGFFGSLISSGSANFGDSFYASASQLASSSIDALRKGQRLR